MKIYNLKEVYNGEFVDWLLNNIPELNAYQKQKIKDINYNQDSEFYIFKKKDKTSNVFYRLTILFFPFVYLFNCFIFTNKFYLYWWMGI